MYLTISEKISLSIALKMSAIELIIKIREEVKITDEGHKCR